MKPPAPLVSVIIATAAKAERAVALRRAIDGALAQEPRPEVVVVVNGAAYDPPLFEALSSRPGVRREYLEVGSYPAAQRRGRELVRTEYFCYLDDDDELLPGSIAARLGRLQASDKPDVVVASGVRRLADADVAYCERRPADEDDLMLSILGDNWFASPAPLFRSARVGVEFFDGRTQWFEWTLLALRLLTAGRRFAFVDTVGFRLHDSPISLSKESRGKPHVPAFLTQLLRLQPGLPEHVCRAIRRRLSDAHHACSDLERERGNPLHAWRHHLRSLLLPGGLRYLAYTRHLVVSRRSAR